ncbi:LADA_0B04566g1_1 [Lachancea dasiensis]|uniref:LADA_0B04566g1_1 n=1 Tax=Lachancea dasiensis TaxID=1072105 RepID=A0A1G4ISV4_9SACH|nr:LADA_0B04566g1_1 [Lachancea dasiensis]
MGIEKCLIGGLPSSIFHSRPIEDGPEKYHSKLFVFVAGNPGLIEFYEPFLSGIQQNNPQWEILGISHAGMNTCDTFHCPVYTLQEQINHKIEVINNYSDKTRHLIIMGHSVGAYMVQKILLSPQLNGMVLRVGLLTPTVIDIHKSEKGTKLTRLNRWIPHFHVVVATVAYVIFEKLLPTYITSLIASTMVDNIDSSVGMATMSLISNSRFVKQALGLAAEEMQVIRSDWAFQDSFLSHCQSRNIKIWFLFSQKDHWVSPETCKDLIKFFKSHSDPKMLEIDVSPTLEHAFVRRHAEVVIREYFGQV